MSIQSGWPEEVFGPVLAVIKAQNYDQALEIANNRVLLDRRGVFEESGKNQKAEETFHVGNLYLKPQVHGAMVRRASVWRFNMYWTDSKAGGKDYLLLFMQEVHRGKSELRFAPALPPRGE